MYIPLNGNFETAQWGGALSLDHPPVSVLKILNGALQAVGQHGVERLSMSAIGKLAGVSRGTLYRYFKTKEDVLRAVSEYVSLAFENGIREVAAGITDPHERLQRVLKFHNEYSTLQEAERILVVDPGFVVQFFEQHAERHRAALLDALGPSLDHFDQSRVRPIDREALADLLIRLQTSRIILRTGPQWQDHWTCFCTLIEANLRDERGPEARARAG